MANHPNRGWRKRLDAAADQWLLTDEAAELAKPSPDPVERRARIRAAYVLGFTAGRASVQKPVRLEYEEAEAVAKLRELIGRLPPEAARDQVQRVTLAYETFGRWGRDVLERLEAEDSGR